MDNSFRKSISVPRVSWIIPFNHSGGLKKIRDQYLSPRWAGSFGRVHILIRRSFAYVSGSFVMFRMQKRWQLKPTKNRTKSMSPVYHDRRRRRTTVFLITAQKSAVEKFSAAKKKAVESLSFEGRCSGSARRRLMNHVLIITQIKKYYYYTLRKSQIYI